MIVRRDARIKLDVISRYRNEIYGICAVWIVLLHAVSDFGFDPSKAYPILKPLVAPLHYSYGVDVFMFLSGLSVYCSCLKTPSTAQFIKRRMMRIFPAALLTFGVAWLLSILLGGGSPLYLFWRLSFLPFFAGVRDVAWFVSTILFLYIAYPTIHQLIYSDFQSDEEKDFQIVGRLLLLILATVILNWLAHKFAYSWYQSVEIGFARVPIFIFGTYIGFLLRRNQSFSRNAVLLVALIGLSWFIFLCIYVLDEWPWWQRLYASASGFFLTLLFACLIHLSLNLSQSLSALWRLMHGIGNYSLELYCTHISLFNCVLPVPKMNGDIKLLVLYVLISFGWSWVCSKYIESFIGHIPQRVRSMVAKLH